MLKLSHPSPIGTLIVLFLVVSFATTSSMAVWSGMKTGELRSKILDPIRDAFTPETEEPTPYFQYRNVININTNTEVQITSTQKTRIIYPKNSPTTTPIARPTYRQVVFPTFPPFNTPTPNPTLVQWNKDFDAKWNEMNDSFEKGKKEICDKNPSASICN